MKLWNFIKEYFEFLRKYKFYWMAPIIIIIVFLTLLVIFTQSSAIAPFVYTLF